MQIVTSKIIRSYFMKYRQMIFYASLWNQSGALTYPLCIFVSRFSIASYRFSYSCPVVRRGMFPLFRETRISSCEYTTCITHYYLIVSLICKVLKRLDYRWRTDFFPKIYLMFLLNIFSLHRLFVDSKMHKAIRLTSNGPSSICVLKYSFNIHQFCMLNERFITALNVFRSIDPIFFKRKSFIWRFTILA